MRRPARGETLPGPQPQGALTVGHMARPHGTPGVETAQGVPFLRRSRPGGRVCRDTRTDVAGRCGCRRLGRFTHTRRRGARAHGALLVNARASHVDVPWRRCETMPQRMRAGDIAQGPRGRRRARCRCMHRKTTNTVFSPDAPAAVVHAVGPSMTGRRRPQRRLQQTVARRRRLTRGHVGDEVGAASSGAPSDGCGGAAGAKSSVCVVARQVVVVPAGPAEQRADDDGARVRARDERDCAGHDHGEPTVALRG